MSIAIERLAAELRKLPFDERERLAEHWAANEDSDAVFGQTSDAGIAERLGEIDRGTA